MKRSPRSIKVALAVATIASSLSAVSSFAAPYLTLEVLARRQGSSDAFSNTVTVGNTSDQLEYQIVMTMGASNAANPFAGAGFQSITGYNPSNVASSLNPSGVAVLGFSLTGTGTGSAISMDSGAVANTTNGQSWGTGTGANAGTVTSRGGGNNDLIKVALVRPTVPANGVGNVDGIDGGSLPISQLVVATGIAKINSIDTAVASQLKLGYQGFDATQSIAGLVWKNGAGTTNYLPSVQEYNNSLATDKLVVINNLTVNGVAAGATDTRVTVAAPNGSLTQTSKTIAFGGWVKGSSAPSATNTNLTNVDDSLSGTPASVTVSSLSPGIVQINGSVNPLNTTVLDGVPKTINVRPSGAAFLQSSGSYTSVALVVNNDNVLDESDKLNITYQVYDPIDVTTNGNATANNANFSNLATNNLSSGPLQAQMDVDFSFAAPHAGIGFTSAGPVTGIAGGASGGNVNFNSTNKLNGVYKAIANGNATYTDTTIQGDAKLDIAFTRTLTENVTGKTINNVGGGTLTTAQTAVVNRALINKVSGYSATESNQKQTTATFLNSATYSTSSGSNPTLSIQFRTTIAGDAAPAGINAIVSDVVSSSLTLNIPTTYVLQISYDPLALTGGTESALASANNIFIGKRDGGGVFGNAGSGTNLGIYSNQLVSGNWGIDITTHTAWVVLPQATNTGLFAVVGGTSAAAITPSNIVVTPANATSRIDGDKVTVANTAAGGSVDNAVLSGLSINNSLGGANGTWGQTGLANGNIAGGANQIGTVSVTFVNNLLKGAKANGTLGFTMGGETVAPSAGAGAYSFPLNATNTTNSAPTGAGTTHGTAQTSAVAAGDKVAGLSTKESGSLVNELSFLDSSVLANQTTVSADWRHRSSNESFPGAHPLLPVHISSLITDVATVSLGANAPAFYVLQMNYDPAGLGAGIDEHVAFLAGHIYLAHMTPNLFGPDTGDGGLEDRWQNATIDSGTPQAGVERGYLTSDLSTPGAWGVDTINHLAWAVLPNSVQGQFAVVPEPASIGLLAIGALGLLRRRK